MTLRDRLLSALAPSLAGLPEEARAAVVAAIDGVLPADLSASSVLVLLDGILLGLPEPMRSMMRLALVVGRELLGWGPAEAAVKALARVCPTGDVLRQRDVALREIERAKV